ncbi:MAG: VOC family protein [Leptospiraceae bacterium]|jgi:uncharacterized glyoxalase superfamily protein PhnB|nr:VOC family protein [Leptospiraceae bacterium]MCZ8346086.1 VOC family protein [Leptospiraceae bacterium]PJE02267.1 MAG: hypothetical protein CK427_08290 [Leptospira sp.]
MKINRMLTNICSERLSESSEFYTKLFDFVIDYESDWFIHLISKESKLELGLIHVNSEIVPKDSRIQGTASYITLVVDNVDDVFEVSKKNKYEIIQEPENTFYGQRRMLLKDPNGYTIDVSSLI